MKQVLIAALLLFLAYKVALYVTRPDPPPPLYPVPYVVVYGRDACGYTQQMRTSLTRTGVPFEYQIVDEPEVATLLHERMLRSGIDIDRYDLPVVDVSGHLSVRPAPYEVIEAMGYSSD